MTEPRTELAKAMYKVAETSPLVADEMRQKADALDVAEAGFFAQPQTVPITKFLGVWAKARVFYCQITGEPLV